MLQGSIIFVVNIIEVISDRPGLHIQGVPRKCKQVWKGMGRFSSQMN